MTVLILDQFVGPSPYMLQREPMRFDDLVAHVRAHPQEYTWGRRPQILEMADGESLQSQQPFATTAFRADAKGMTVVCGARWDSSD